MQELLSGRMISAIPMSLSQFASADITGSEALGVGAVSAQYSDFYALIRAWILQAPWLNVPHWVRTYLTAFLRETLAYLPRRARGLMETCAGLVSANAKTGRARSV